MSELQDTYNREDVLKLALSYQTLYYELEQEFQTDKASARAVMNEFEASLEQFKHCQRLCAEWADSDERAAVLCSKLAGVSGNLLDQRLPRLDLIRWREEGLAGARKAKLIEDQVGHLTYLSYAHFGNNHASKALMLLDEASELTQQLEDPRGYATILQHRGMFYTQLDRIEEAIAVLTESLAIFGQLDDSQEKSKTLSTLAICFSRKNDPQRAVDLYKQAIDMEHDRSAVGTYLCNISGDLIKLGRLSEAWEYLEKAEVISKNTANNTLEGLVATHLGQWHSVQPGSELRNKAWVYYENALTIFRKKGDRHYEQKVSQILISLYSQVLNSHPEQLNYDQVSYALRQLIPLLMALGRLEDAIQACNRLLEQADLSQNYPDQLEAAISLGHVMLQQGLYDQAIKAHTKAIEIMGTIRSMEDEDSNLKAEGELQLSLGQAYRHSNQPERAIQCYEKAEKIAENPKNQDIKHRAIGNRGLICADQQRHSEAVELLTKVVAYYNNEDYRLFGHAQFNLAYAYHRNGDREIAKETGTNALRVLTIINDSKIEEIKQQLNSW